MNTTGKIAVITGAASGLGAALTQTFTQHGYAVALADVDHLRGQDFAAELAREGHDTAFFACDVTDLRQVEQLAEQVMARWGQVDVLINNAGVAAAGPIEDVPLDDWRWLFDINVFGVVRGCRVFTPIMKRQGHGHIINIASAAALMTPPFMSSYNAAKAAVLAISDTLRSELAYCDINVTAVCPGFFATNLGATLRTTHPAISGFFEKVMTSADLTAADVATQIFDAYNRKQYLLVPHPTERRLWRLRRFLPEVFAGQIKKRFTGLHRKLTQ